MRKPKVHITFSKPFYQYADGTLAGKPGCKRATAGTFRVVEMNHKTDVTCSMCIDKFRVGRTGRGLA